MNENGVKEGDETVTATIDWAKHPTITTYTGPASGTFSDPVQLSGTLTDALASAPLSGQTLNLSVGTDNCNDVTDALGIAECSVVLTQVPGAYIATASFAGTSQYDASTDSASFVIKKETTILTYTGPTLIANGLPITLSGVLTEDDGPFVQGRTVNFVLGSGGSAQTCSGVTNASGLASCTIALVNQPLGPGTVSDSFAGDAFYLRKAHRPTRSCSNGPSGNFVISNGNSGVGVKASFVRSQWESANSVSGGNAPPAFKGFAGIPAGPTTCGGRFNASPGNSTPPPDSVPSFTPMLVTSSVIKNGDTIMGTKPSIVVVQTNPGYGPAPGHAGTAQVVAVLCP